MSRQKPYKQQRSKQQSSRAKSNRGLILAIIGGVIILAAVVVGVLIALNNAPAKAADPGSITTIQKQNWPQPDGIALGPANAPVVVKEFADFQCPVCKVFNETVQPNIINDYVKTGKVRYEFHFFNVIDMNTGGTESLHAAVASLCAANQQDFWDYHEILYANQQGEASGAFSDSRLKAFAISLGLDSAKFDSCLDKQETKGTVVADEAIARTLNISGTPSVFVNGKLVANSLDYASVKDAIDTALKAAGQ
ncbi:MAG TPA: DsbA family protein [Pseudomonadales bacterium]|nr:DsbA family protein [Pseudomonadales bacterium]